MIEKKIKCFFSKSDFVKNFTQSKYDDMKLFDIKTENHYNSTVFASIIKKYHENKNIVPPDRRDAPDRRVDRELPVILRVLDQQCVRGKHARR